MKVWVVYCWTSGGVLYDRRPYLSEAGAREAVTRFRKKYPLRKFLVEYGHAYHFKEEEM